MELRLLTLLLSLPLLSDGSTYFEDYAERFGRLLTASSGAVLGPAIADPDYDHDVEVYDFVVVGAGTAGCVLAGRLSEARPWDVLLLEAGVPESPVAKIPAASRVLLASMIDNVCHVAAGRGLGGGSAVSDGVYVVGSRRDYDEWLAEGNAGWGYDDVLPYFKRAEHVRLRDYDEGYRGERGPVDVELQRNPSRVRRPFLRAAEELNYTVLDYNGRTSVGFGDAQVATRHGRKGSASAAYLEDAHARPNLVVKTSSLVERVLIDGGEAFGAVYVRGGRRMIAKARKEVLVSAGAVGSPKVLQLSGVGPKDYLEGVGIRAVADLPVGNNLRDHVAFLGLQYVFEEWHPDIDYLHSFYEWFSYGEGPLASCGVDALGFLSSGGDPERADVEIALSPLALNRGYRLLKPLTNFRKETYDSFWQDTEGRDSFAIVVVLSRANSTGTVRIASTDPHDDPLIDPRYLEDPDDVETMLYGVRRALEISNATAFRKINATLNVRRVEGCDRFEFSTDEYWRCAIRRLTVSAHHLTGTNRMGPGDDGSAVVDSQLKVHGIRRLRVVDASIVPNAIVGHTMAPVLMIAERAADIIKEHWKEDHQSYD